jgi:hypothetical protein
LEHIGNVLWPKPSENNRWHERKHSAKLKEYFPDNKQCHLPSEGQSVDAGLSQVAKGENVCCQTSVPEEQDGERQQEY